MEEWESDSMVEQWLLEHDHKVMPLPSIESNPHLLTSKVRKHYMEYLIKLLSVNYENNQRLLNKNIYLPSAIWRCAKIIEMTAAQTAMVVSLYRKNIINVVQDLKKTTKNGLLYKKLYECLHFQPENEKKTQARFLNDNSTCNCQCICNLKKNIKKTPGSPRNSLGFQRVDNEISHINLKPSIKKEETQQAPEQACLNTTTTINASSETESKESDDLMQQLEKIFKDDPNDDDIFDSTLYETSNLSTSEETKALPVIQSNALIPITSQENEAQPKCLDDRLEQLSGMLVSNHNTGSQDCTGTRTKKSRVSKWLCEEYFMKIKLFELLDQIGDSDRKKLARIKDKLRELFGDDSGDDDMVSPLDESPEFVISCKERIAPWVVKLLTPYYVNGRIRGKNLFKALAKHLIKLIYQCSKYPHEFEVASFIKDFLDNHRMIRCEADFKQFRIENV